MLKIGYDISSNPPNGTTRHYVSQSPWFAPDPCSYCSELPPISCVVPVFEREARVKYFVIFESHCYERMYCDMIRGWVSDLSYVSDTSECYEVSEGWKRRSNTTYWNATAPGGHRMDIRDLPFTFPFDFPWGYTIKISAVFEKGTWLFSSLWIIIQITNPPPFHSNFLEYD